MCVDKRRVLDALNKFSEKKVIVLGGFCLDEYIYGTANSISPEAPVQRVVIDSVKYMPGAAANVACGVKDLGAQTYACGVLGDDLSGKRIYANFRSAGIDSSGIILVKTRNTPTYSRIVAGNHTQRQQLIRFDVENKREIDDEFMEITKSYLDREVKNSDAVIFADYDEIGNGLVRPSILECLVYNSRKQGTILVGISRKRLSRFCDFTLLVPNRKEAEEAIGLKLRTVGELEKGGKMLVQRLNSNIAITRGEEGVSVFSLNAETEKVCHLPSFAKNIIDVTGAGDSFTVATTLALASGATLFEAAYLGNHAAAVAVRKEGTTSVKREEILEQINGT